MKKPPKWHTDECIARSKTYQAGCWCHLINRAEYEKRKKEQSAREQAMKCYARDDTKPLGERTSCQLEMNHTGHHDHGGHRWSMRVNGSRRCYDCGTYDYDSQWGAGIFNDWPRGHHKPYGS